MTGAAVPPLKKRRDIERNETNHSRRIGRIIYNVTFYWQKCEERYGNIAGREETGRGGEEVAVMFLCVQGILYSVFRLKTRKK